MINPIACNHGHGASERALGETAHDLYMSHNASTGTSSSSTTATSKQSRSEVLGNSDNPTEICAAFEGALKSNLDILSNQDSESHHSNNGFSELQSGEDLGHKHKEVAQDSTTHEPAVIPSIVNYRSKRRYRPRWDQRFQELVDFAILNQHANVPQKYGPLGLWVNAQRIQYRLWKEGKDSRLTTMRRRKLESIGFAFACHTVTPWEQRFQELVAFKKVHGHENVPRKCGPLGKWVNSQRMQYRLWEQGKASKLTSERRQKLKDIGFVFSCHIMVPWDQRFQELVEFKKINGHDYVPTKSGSLGAWVSRQRRYCRLSKEGKDSPLTSERRQKLESIEFAFARNT